jgi:hypothetical protein
MARFWQRRRSEDPRSGLVSFDREEIARLNARFAALDRHQRREIMRAVNRGQVVKDRRQADIAIGVARRQQRFWRFAWLLGPSLALAQAAMTPIGLQEGLLLAAWGTLLLGGMAWWWHSRAARSELLNAELFRRRPGAGRRDDRHRGSGRAAERPSQRRPRLPGGPPPEPSAENEDDDDLEGDESWTEDRPGPTGPRPPRPRRRKRR